jgi:hypothetical protein
MISADFIDFLPQIVWKKAKIYWQIIQKKVQYIRCENIKLYGG